ncbi:MAG: DUF6259 domain-containing protein [Planctomycetia bacterium]|nr:DUF6259 domain-containing protein [Planctomycetia bacterium]
MIVATETVIISSSTLKMILEKELHETGYESLSLISLIDLETNQSLITDGKSNLFSLEVRSTIDSTGVPLFSQSKWRNIEVVQEDNGSLRLIFNDPESLGSVQSVSVVVTLQGTSDSPEIRMSWSGQSFQDRWTLWRGKFPILPFCPFGEQMKAFYPELSGLVRDNPFATNFSYRGDYPNGWNAAMAFCALWDESTQHGLYLAALDPDANLKVFEWKGNEEIKSVFSIDTPFENMGKAHNSFQENGVFVLRAFNGNWYDAARLYKQWVFLEAKWRPDLGVNGRTDIAPWMKENSVFLMASTDPRWLTPNRRVYTPLEEMDQAFAEFSEAVGLSGAVHWYLWHQNSYDNDYPHFFPAKEGFAEEVAEVQSRGHFRVMPYTNGRLWDTKDKGMEDWKYSAEGKKGALVRENGSVLTETYALPTSGKEEDGSPCILAAMCPGSEVWQKKVRENVLTAMNVYGTTGVYIDQVGAVAPFPCHSPEHGHPSGGGHWWLTEGYWKIFAKIRQDMRREVSDIPFSPEVAEKVRENPSILNDRIITTECNSEVYAHLIDGFLTWHWQNPSQVPAFPVVYGGAVPMFGRCSTGNSLALQMRVSQALTWGEQIGWFDPAVRNDEAAFPFIRDAIRCRHALRHYFYRGEMLRAPKFEEPLPSLTADWVWGGQANTHTEPAIQASVWRIVEKNNLNCDEKKSLTSFKSDSNQLSSSKENEKRSIVSDNDFDQKATNSVILLFSNASDQEVVSRVFVRLDELGLEKDSFRIRRIDAEETSELTYPSDFLENPIHFPPKKSFALELFVPEESI